MTKLWRWYARWSEAREGSRWERAYWFVTGLLFRGGLLARDETGSGYFRDHEWNWCFWRGPYWRFVDKRGNIVRPLPKQRVQ